MSGIALRYGHIPATCISAPAVPPVQYHDDAGYMTLPLAPRHRQRGYYGSSGHTPGKRRRTYFGRPAIFAHLATAPHKSKVMREQDAKRQLFRRRSIGAQE